MLITISKMIIFAVCGAQVVQPMDRAQERLDEQRACRKCQLYAKQQCGSNANYL